MELEIFWKGILHINLNKTIYFLKFNDDNYFSLTWKIWYFSKCVFGQPCFQIVAIAFELGNISYIFFTAQIQFESNSPIKQPHFKEYHFKLKNKLLKSFESCGNQATGKIMRSLKDSEELWEILRNFKEIQGTLRISEELEL